MTVEQWGTFVPMVIITMVLLFALGLGLGAILGSRWRVYVIPHPHQSYSRRSVASVRRFTRTSAPFCTNS